jgi:hypothetical protein
MQILDVEPFDREELLNRIRRTPLIGFDQALVYAQSSMSLEVGVDPNELVPAQRYVLHDGIETVLELREALLVHGVDIFALGGGLWVRTEDNPEDKIPVIPPIIEESEEPGGRRVLLINDGQHRVYAARQMGLPISVVVVREVPTELPYYALALADWSDVVELKELPDGFQKKTYRVPANYKALFRNFNAVLPGVQAQRKRSNPNDLQP